MTGFEGKVCLVTGGAKGIGRAIVVAFVEAGARVAFCDIDGEAGSALAAKPDIGSRVMFGQVDVRDAGALVGFMAGVYAEWGDVDIIVNNVGISTFSPLAETPVALFDDIIATNLRPVFVTSREMARRRSSEKPEDKATLGEANPTEATPGSGNHPGNNAHRYGRIINIASTRWLQSEPGTEGYSASKGGIVALTHALAASLAGTGITVNCISPGWIDTGHYGKLRPEDHAQHPSGRVGTPEDIARACLFLAAPENDFIDGQNLVIDGGMTSKMIYVE